MKKLLSHNPDKNQAKIFKRTISTFFAYIVE